MKELLLNKTPLAMAADQNARIQEAVQQERKRLLNFIRKRLRELNLTEKDFDDIHSYVIEKSIS